MSKENLLKAIENAKGHGKCKYIDNGCPQCVVAQLFIIEGGDPVKLADWVGTASAVTGGYHPPELEKYNPSLLDMIQLFWDQSSRTEDESRQKMRELVEKADAFGELYRKPGMKNWCAAN